MHTHLDEKEFGADHAIEIGHRVWWVGHQIPGDIFQCHAYLIEHGDQSVLIDPGSALTFKETLKKIEEVTAFTNIRYFICHHQDPDITAALAMIDTMVCRDDAVIVTHWRAEALLKHYALNLPMWLVDANDWKLDLGGRLLKFIFTPYLHFPGAFCTFDEESGILFSSDLFGGFTEEPSLFAEDESYFECMRPFHEHYMPSREILQHALINIEKEEVRLIAPQHGSIIPEELTGYMIEKLKGLECGLYLMAQKDSDVNRLMELNKMIKGFMSALVLYRDFSDIAHYLCGVAKEILPVEALEFYVKRKGEENYICFSPENKYHGETLPKVSFVTSVIDNTLEASPKDAEHHYDYITFDREGKTKHGLSIPLDTDGNEKFNAAAIFLLSSETEISDELNEVLGRMCLPLSVAIERETIYHMLEIDRNEIYEKSIRDPLTGLYTRCYMKDSGGRLLDSHDRNEDCGVALIMLDVDYFKSVNDKYGHTTGDMVLKSVGKVIIEQVRKVDIPVRYGGEEFAIFLPVQDIYAASMIAERIRKAIDELTFTRGDESFKVTMSAGVAIHLQGESMIELIIRADKALYNAKESGRNRTCRAK